MKILLVLGKYLPDKKGGIENYSHTLAKALLSNGHNVDVAILDRNKIQSYTFEDVNIITLKADLNIFRSLLEKEQYYCCHFQEYHGPRGINIAWLKMAKQFCKKVFFTFHLPYLTCYKNDFRYLGIEDCNTFTNTNRCVKCIIATKLNYKKTGSISVYNLGVDLLFRIIRKTGNVKHLKDRIRLRKEELNDLVNTCDQVFIYGAWFKEILIKNGFDSPKLKLIPHIIKSAFDKSAERNLVTKNKVLFAGRIEEQKGLRLLCKAMNKISAKEVRLDVAGNIIDENYIESCAKEYSFNYLGALPHSQLLSLLHGYDFLILPSVFTEMYSLVIREAFYEYLPVIASAAKGNVDVINEGKNGFIFNYNDYRDLAKVIDKAYLLKRNGWKPEFETRDNSKDDLREILSYYS